METMFGPNLSGPTRPNGPEFRKKVEWLLLLRLLVTTLLLAVTIFFQLRETGEFFLHPAIPLYVLIVAIFVLSIIYALSLPLLPDLHTFSFVQVMVDIVYATVLVHFTGGASSVFTLLYVLPIITSGILHFRKGALAAASLSGVMFGVLINLLFYNIIPSADWPWVSPWSRNTPEYVLWVLVVHLTLFFLIAVVSGSLAEQLRRARYSLNLTQSDLSSLTELHDSIVRSIPSGIITTSEADSITFINNAGLTFLNVPAQEVIGAPLAQVFPMGDKDLIAVGDHEETFLTQREVRGEQRSFELTLSDLNWPDELPRGRLVVFQDVTRMRKMEDRVKQSERQSAFVRIAAGLAHEIRNPLAALRGAAELLSRADEKVVPDKRLLSIIIRESDRLNGLLGDFLVTVNSGQRTKDRVMLTDLIQDTVDLFAKEAHLSEKASIETRLKKGVVVEGDPSRLKQALWNLLKNAVEAGSHNQVIRVTLESDGAQAALKVLDQGSGITPEIRARMFEPFATTKDRGTGLGLPLVLSVAEAHNGTVEVDSSPGIGTLFTLRLPILPGDSPKEGR